MASRSARRAERAPQVSGRIVFGASRCDGVAEYLAAGLAEPPRCLDYSAIFDFPEHFQQFGSVQVGDRHRCRQFLRLQEINCERRRPRSNKF
jgi:hypothetical protein